MRLLGKWTARRAEDAGEVLELASAHVWGTRADRPFTTVLLGPLVALALREMPSGANPEAAARVATRIAKDPASNPVAGWLEAGGLVGVTQFIATAVLAARTSGFSADDFQHLLPPFEGPSAPSNEQRN